MKKNLFVFCLLVFAATGIFAQEGAQGTKIEGYSAMSPAERAKDATDKLNQTVQLSAEQYSKVLEINKDFYGKVQTGTGNLPAVKSANERDSKVKALLTPAQVQKLNAAKPDTHN
jgi:hypothetical protein